MPSLSFAFHLLFLLVIFSFTPGKGSHSFHNDHQSLVAFRKLITSDPQHSLADWTPANHFCNWTGVTCNRRHPLRVASLNLTLMDLSGSISPSLGNLSFLRTLDLSGNALTGHIPPQLGRLFRLRELVLDNNGLDGNIPTQLCSCRNLTYLSLSFNNLTGNIPSELGSLPLLQKLYLGENELTGTIPSSLGNLSSLIQLTLEANTLTGNIPSELGSLQKLQVLALGENELTGTIPSSLGNLSSLIQLGLEANSLTGSIPSQLIGCKNLTILLLEGNHLTGNIPRELGSLRQLQELSLERNELTGTIPSSLGRLTRLQLLSLGGNDLSGRIPTSLSNMLNLQKLNLAANQLNGEIPKFIGNFSNLVELSLSYNKLSGTVPIELGKLSFIEFLHLNNNQLDSGNAINMPFLTALTNCSHLNHLWLHNNKLSGVLPLAIGRLSTNLSMLALSNNKIQGNIPPHIGNLSSLTFLNLSENFLNGNVPPLGKLVKIERLCLSNNNLEGNIPDYFESLQHLGLLDLSGNSLSGKIPNSLSLLKQLRRLHLHHNNLSGIIPSSLGHCKNLELLDLSHNRLSGSIPHEIGRFSNLQFYLNLSWNLLEGSLPMEIGKIAMAQAIDISVNQLVGAIPPALGSCNELQLLNLSRNSFQGSIPESLGNLQSLASLDLSLNNLSSIIPVVTLKNLKMLQSLNLSFNNFIGEIPEGGFFANRTIVMSLIGNPGLCGPQVFQLPACQTPRHHFALVKRLILPVSGVAAFILCCLLLGFLWKRKGFLWNRNMLGQNFDSSQAILQRLEHKRISYQELHIATNGFAEANLLGTGNFGSVYKGILIDGTLVAIKVFHLLKDKAEKSFKAECSVLQKVRHRNLVKIITSCCNIDFKGLVFKFMSNGSLEKHLYPNTNDNNGEDACEMGLKTRLDIAIDVAHAIEYLHHDSFVQVVHCDLKPNNVLIDEDMSGHVTDFGIARLVDETSTESLTSTLSLKGSMGYIAPEYGFGQPVSTKGDIYSYGILLLEMLTRKRPTNDMFSGDLNLHKWVNLAFPSSVKEVIDNNLLREVEGDEFEENNVFNCISSLIQVGLVCSKDSPNERPTMRDVVMVLENLRNDLGANAIASRRLRQSISNLLSNTNATRSDTHASNAHSSSSF
eukprot:PITA_14467